MQIGGYRIDPVIDGEGRQPATEVFPGTKAEQWAPHNALLDAAGRLTVTVGAFLVRGPGRTMLVDLGYGPGALGRIGTGRLMTSLRGLGVEPEQVTDVVFTHLHRDHVGWASVDGVPQFPNATLRCAGADYSYFVVEGNGDPSIADRLRPCLAHVEPFDEDDQAVLVPGVDAAPAPGHTPGSTVLVFSGGTERVVVLGDVAHHPVQLLESEWNTLYDIDPVLARRTRERVLR
ncbi:MAG: MBL fold metallo-hydrolase, partial [Actinomycetota bacterium]|nr:MBL fold metallo-hydrolase [Actinomycetota bacterium]